MFVTSGFATPPSLSLLVLSLNCPPSPSSTPSSVHPSVSQICNLGQVFAVTLVTSSDECGSAVTPTAHNSLDLGPYLELASLIRIPLHCLCRFRLCGAVPFCCFAKREGDRQRERCEKCRSPTRRKEPRTLRLFITPEWQMAQVERSA